MSVCSIKVLFCLIVDFTDPFSEFSDDLQKVSHYTEVYIDTYYMNISQFLREIIDQMRNIDLFIPFYDEFLEHEDDDSNQNIVQFFGFLFHTRQKAK